MIKRSMVPNLFVCLLVLISMGARADLPSPTVQNITVEGTLNGGTPISVATVSGGTLHLPQTSAYLRVMNLSGMPLSVVPAASPAEGATITVLDWGGNAETYNWTFQGTLNGVLNPTINTVNGGLCTLVYSAQGGWGTSP